MGQSGGEKAPGRPYGSVRDPERRLWSSVGGPLLPRNSDEWCWLHVVPGKVQVGYQW